MENMKKPSFFILIVLLLSVNALAAVGDLSEKTRKDLKDSKYVVETGPDDDSDSLNRISGQYDPGFSAPEQSFSSSHNYRPGPFGREEAKDKRS